MIVNLDLSKKKEKLKKEITKNRDEIFEGGFVYLGEEYPCDPVFQEAVKTYLMSYSLGILAHVQQVRIRRMDNTFWYPNFSELVPFAGALMVHVESIWTDYWNKKDSL
jgi:hypothetical protein